MFSGLTNQVSSLFSKNTDEQVPTPPQSATGEAEHQIPSTEPAAVENNNAEGGEKHRYGINFTILNHLSLRRH